MDMSSAALDRYAFYWSEARLVVSALALFMGGVPPVLMLNPFPALGGVLGNLLTLAWVISGVVSLYLLYRWLKNNKKLYGRVNVRDRVAFCITAVTGLNLGFAGIATVNIGMMYFSGAVTFTLTGLLYLVVALYQWQTWRKAGENLF